MQLKLMTPTRVLIDSEVDEITAPGVAGEMGILSQHVTFLGQLGIGAVSYKVGGKVGHVVVRGGYVEVVEDIVTILADDAEHADEIDAASARAEMDRLQRETRTAEGSPEQIDALMDQIRLAEVRSAVSR